MLKIFESWAEGLAPDLFDRLVLNPTRDIISRIRAAGIEVPIMGFARGAGLNAIRYATVSYGKLMSLISDLRDLGLTNVLAARDTRPLTRNWLTKLDESYASHFARKDGKLQATFEIVWITGWAPHDSQQKPLKPGSAKMRLADALKTKETKI